MSMYDSPVPTAAPPARPLDEATLQRYRGMSGEDAQLEWHRVMEESLRGQTMDPSVPQRLQALIDVCARRGVGVIPG